MREEIQKGATYIFPPTRRKCKVLDITEGIITLCWFDAHKDYFWKEQTFRRRIKRYEHE